MNLSCPNCDRELKLTTNSSDWFECPRCKTVLEFSNGILLDKTLDSWVAHFSKQFQGNQVRWVIFLALQFFSFFGLHSVWKTYELMERDEAAKAWPVTRGVLSHVYVRKDRNNTQVSVRYAYSVGSQSFESTQISCGRDDAKWMEGDNLAKTLQTGMAVDVHYDPTKSSDAVLRVGVSQGDYIELITWILVLVLVAAGLIVLWWVCSPAKMQARLRVVRRLYARLCYFGYEDPAENSGPG